MGQSISNPPQENQDIQLFTSLSDQPAGNDRNKRIPTTLKSARSSEYRIKDFKRAFQHKKKITALYIYDDYNESSHSNHLIDDSNINENYIGSIVVNKKSSGKQLWTASTDKTIICWNLKNGTPNTLFQGHTDTVSCLKIRDSLLYSASYDRTIRIWDLNEKHKHCIDVIPDQENWLTSLELWKNFIICAGYAKNINIYDLTTKQKVRTFIGHTKRIESLLVDDCVLYSSSVDGAVKLWDLEQGICIRTLHARDQCLSVNIWNEKFIIIGQQEDVICWNLETYDSNKLENNDDTHNVTQQHAVFVGLSVYCIYDFLLIGWNRGKKRFEFWNMYNTLFQNSDSNSEYPKLIHIIPTEILMCSALFFNPDVLFYVSGTQIASISVSLKLDDVIKRTQNKDLFEIENENQNEVNENLIDKNIQQPAYSLYTRLFHYFTDSLLHPTTKVANAIEKLHNEGKLSLNFDSQVLILGEYLRNISHQNLINESGEQISESLDFTIFLNSKQETENGPLPEIYTKDQLSLDFESRIDLFYKKLQAITTDVFQPTVIVVRREELVFDACKHFIQLSLSDLKRPLYIFFANEKGLDSGGLAAEFYRLIGEEILNENNVLFENKGKNTYFPNAKSSVNETHLQYFKFIGRVVGKALFDMQLMNTHFSSVLFKYIIGKVVTFSDLQFVDRTMYLSLKKILELEDVDSLNLEFAAEIDDFGKSNTFYLLDNSKTSEKDLIVTTKNKYKFVELLSRWILIESIRYQVELFLEGVYEVIPKPYFKIFNETELELLLCGSPKLDLADWKEHTHLDGFEENDPSVEYFWDAVKSMNQTERGKVLSFVCGTSNPPVGGFVNLHPAFCISKMHGATKNHLPKSQTCINQLSLPEGYENVEWCLNKLRTAIEGGNSFELV